MKLKQRKNKNYLRKKINDNIYKHSFPLLFVQFNSKKAIIWFSKEIEKNSGLGHNFYVKLYFIFTLIVLPSPPLNINS